MDAIDVCLNGHFLVVCEKNGNLHLIYVPQKRILLTRVCVLACVISVLDLLLSLFCLLGFVFYFFPHLYMPMYLFWGFAGSGAETIQYGYENILLSHCRGEQIICR